MTSELSERDRALRNPPLSDWLVGGGEMGDLVRAHDWSKTPLGPIESWPQSLRTTVSLCLSSTFPMNIIWGPESTQIYNDGYRVVCGDVHPQALGEDYRVTWASAWPAIGDSFERAWAGERMFLENQRMFLKRLDGALEETFFTFSHSPIQDESGQVGGLFHPVTETTATMLAERRTRALRDLSASLAAASDEADVARRTVDVLAQFEFDLPFLLYYALDPISGSYALAAHHGIAPERHASPPSLSPEAKAPWPIARALKAAGIVEVDDLTPILRGEQCGPYDEAPSRGFVIPIVVPAAERPPAVLITGASSRLRLNTDYRSFYDLLGVTIAGALSTVRAREDERRRAEALAEIDRAKTAFFSNVSHEFRTPLTLMLGPLEETLASGGELPAGERDRLETAHRNAMRLLKLVNTLLDFSRIEAGRTQAVYEPMDLAAATIEPASVFRSAIEKAGLVLKVDCPPISRPVYIDRDMWEKIVLNLLSNAFKFTFAGEIEIRLRETASHAELIVRDTGTGIPREELPRLFERFHRVAGAHGRTHEGSGIGLALVQELARLHGGSVSVESVLGQGSTFRVALPFGRDHLPSAQIGAVRTTASTALGAAPFVEEALRWLPDGEDANGVAMALKDAAPDPAPDLVQGAAAEEEAQDRPRILLADDNADMRDYVRRLLATRYDVEAVADGEAALAAIARDRPDLVLSDIMMPRLDGMELLARLRTNPETSTLPVILLSARAGEESRVEGMQAGADDYLIKPFSARELMARVEAHVRLSRYRSDAERTVRESEARYRQLANLLPVAVYTCDAAGRITYYNPQAARLWGREPRLGDSDERFCGSDTLLLPSGERLAHDESPMAVALREGASFRQEAVDIRRPDGSRISVRTNVDPIRDCAGRIIGAVNVFHDVTEMRRAEEASARLAAIVESSDDAIVSKDLNGVIASWNEGARRIFGFAPEEAIGRPITIIIPEERWDEETEILSRLKRGERIEHFETRRRRKDGSMLDVSLTISPVKDREGRIIGASKIARDITERKRAEETQRLLIAELNHRVKNMLASVQAIAQHTLRNTREPQDFVNSFSGRIQSLARVHALLSASTWRSADLNELVRDQLLNGAIDQARLSVEGPRVQLQPQSALHVALILHELGTNAVKYGALSTPEGAVSLRWRVADQTVQMRWEERGGPPARVPTKRGFGTNLIEQSAKSEGGSAQMLVETGGVAWEIKLPLPETDAAASALRSAARVAHEVPCQKSAQSSANAAVNGALSGRRFLVVEDEPLVALDLSDILEDAGAVIAASAGSFDEAFEAIANESFDAALLDANLGGRSVDALAEALARRGVPFMFVTGYGKDSLPEAFQDAEIVNKPFFAPQILKAAAGLVRK